MSPPLSLLLSTPHAVWQFDSASETLRCLHSGRSEYYGISWNDRGVVLSHSLDDNVVPWNQGDCYREDRFGVCVQHSLTGDATSQRVLLHPHQVECVGNRVLAANTGRNAISLWHPESGGLATVYMVASHWDGLVGETISLHLNSVHVQDDLLYAVAHNGNLASAVWAYRWPSMDLHAVFSTSTHWAHNAWHSASLAGLLICDSKAGALHSVDYTEAVWTTATPATLTRGLAATDDVIVVGLSEFTPRAERGNSKGGFAIIERSTLRTTEEFWFDGIGNVHEVRVLSEPDACHTSLPPSGAARAWIDAAGAASARQVHPMAKGLGVEGVSQSAPELSALPALLEYDGGAAMSVDVRAPGVAIIRTERSGDSNLVLASVAAADCPAGALLHASGWCTVDDVAGEAYGLLRICFRDRSGQFLPELEVRSNPVGFAEATHGWFDVACAVPADSRVAGIECLWLQSGIASIELKGCAFSVSPLPGSLRTAKAIRCRLDKGVIDRLGPLS